MDKNHFREARPAEYLHHVRGIATPAVADTVLSSSITPPARQRQWHLCRPADREGQGPDRLPAGQAVRTKQQQLAIQFKT